MNKATPAIAPTKWSHLPNAVHIDRIIASLKDNPKEWAAAEVAAWAPKHVVHIAVAWNAAWAAAAAAAWDAAATAAWDASLPTSLGADAARGAILALIVYADADSAKYLDYTYKDLELITLLTNEPAAVLILSALQAFELIKELELA